MPCRIIRVPWDINSTMYDSPSNFNPFFKKLQNILTVGRILPNKEECTDVILVDEEKLLKLRDYVENHPDEVLKGLDIHRERVKGFLKKDDWSRDWIEKRMYKRIIREEGLDPL